VALLLSVVGVELVALAWTTFGTNADATLVAAVFPAAVIELLPKTSISDSP
jgi:hypothetical protein